MYKLILSSFVMFIFFEANAQVFSRKYKVGETYRYKLTTDVLYNGKSQGSVVAECILKVVSDSAGIPFDEITWVSLLSIKDKDTVANNEAVQAVKPYRISLHPGGKINMPPLDVAAMTGPITDFNTFFVAISPQLDALKLANKGETIVKKDPVKGDFANGRTILKGEDCLMVSINMQEKSDSTVLLRTNFLPPSENCLAYLTDDMKTSVTDGVINNFQMVQPAGPDKYNVNYGNETFIITSTIRRADGKLLRAEMSNTLLLKTKLQCDSAYANCQGPFPFKIDRSLKLELIKF